MPTPLYARSIKDLTAAIRRKEFTAEAVTAACLERAFAQNGTLCAWAHLDADRALAAARALDNAAPMGPLHGIPVGIKDITDVAGMPTTCGSPIYTDNIAFADAPCVAQLRKAGAVILGKTVTVEFAGSQPSPTRNPGNLAHTPGGSSSGSAAAVADLHVPAATGTQTGGSIIRPAAYCGAVGFKPSFGALPFTGTKCASWSLDTFGVLTRTSSDARLMFDAILGEVSPDEIAIRPRRIGILATDLHRQTADQALAMGKVSSSLADGGVEIEVLPPTFDRDEALKARQTIARYEMVRSFAYETSTASTLLSDHMHADLEAGRRISRGTYIKALRYADTARRQIGALLKSVDAVMTHATEGEAPFGLADTGPSTFQSAWTLLHLPCLSLPVAVGPNGLPISIQLVGATHEDVTLLSHVAWLEAALAAADRQHA